MRWIVELTEVGRADGTLVGGKAAQLGELTRVEGIEVPAGFCVTTDALALATADLSADAAAAPLPARLRDAVAQSVAGFGDGAAFAVRSSGTAEDLPDASFAGVYDSVLNVVGVDEVLAAIRRCRASLCTSRARAYRRRVGIPDADARMAVLVQRMVPAEAAGVLFTADPVTSNRRVAVVEAVAGPGDALVSGLVVPDRFDVRDGTVVEASRASTRDPAGTRPLTDAQAIELVRLGRRIEAHFAAPQDIEWCRVGDRFEFVQTRPVTTLFPIPQQVPGDEQHHHGAEEPRRIFVSVGHQQMMTDAMRPLGLSLWQLTTPRPMYEAAGRLFVDVAPTLATPAGRSALVDTLGRSDPLIGDALQTLLARDGVVALTDEPADDAVPPTPDRDGTVEADPTLVTALVARYEQALADLRTRIDGCAGTELVDLIVADVGELRRLMSDPASRRVLMAGMGAAWWLGEHLEQWLGAGSYADTLSRSAPHNVTSQMGLALLDVADVLRPHPEAVAFLRRVAADPRDDDFLHELADYPGGRAICDAFLEFLTAYGARCGGEIDITRARWVERPAALVSTLLGNVDGFDAGESGRRFDEGARAAQAAEQTVLRRLRALPDGDSRAEQAKSMIDRLRAFAGYREYPKFAMVNRYLVYKQALLREASRLASAGVLDVAEDVYYLRLPELRTVFSSGVVDRALIRDRRARFLGDRRLTPPRVLTSEGEVIIGRYGHDSPAAGTLTGLGVSAGVVEGRARVVTDMETARLQPGDILVTAHTDPGWTPLFVTAAGLITEVGGLLTHGAVVAREYGLPAVVGVPDATGVIADGERVRLDGSTGRIELPDRAGRSVRPGCRG